ncbi:MAG: hypothetical protein HYV07_27020 [Deltaproteobacteria bacterium]|nr:hypothetical protein [Deltaproteobacteria bacterium]
MSQKAPRRLDARLLAGIFLISTATLTLELGLTRVLSVRLWYHFGFLVISTALLGFGVSGVVAALRSRPRDDAELERSIVRGSLLFGVLSIVSLPALMLIPFRPFELLSDHLQLLWMPVYYVTLASPFFASGWVISRILAHENERASTLYAADLVGAGLGAALIGVVLPALGGPGTVVFAAALAFVAASVMARASRWRAGSVAGAVLAAAGCAFATQLPPPKAPPGTTFVSANWNTFSYVIEARRVDSRQRTEGSRAPKLTRAFIIDMGAAVTGTSEAFGGFDKIDPDSVHDSPSIALALLGKKGASVAVIGSGAGREVREALWAGARSVAAVEINEIINDAVLADAQGAFGGLFRDPRVRLYTDEGRSFLRRSTESFDAILSLHTISNAAMSSGALGLAENHTLTLEAFVDNLDRLTGDGTLFLTRPESQLPRLFSTAREALARRGITSARDHLYAFRFSDSPAPPRDQTWFTAGFLMKKSPLSARDLEVIERELVPRGPYPFVTEVLYSPRTSSTAEPSIYERLVSTDELPKLYDEAPFELAPATDDRPFFNHRTRWSKLAVADLLEVFRLSDRRSTRMALEDRPVAEVVLVVSLLETSLVAAFLIGLPLLLAARRGQRIPAAGSAIGYFGLLGVSFIFVELALISSFSLFLGQPVYAMAVVLASLLVFTGLGAFLSGQSQWSTFWGRPGRAPLWAALVVVAWTWLVPEVFDATLGLGIEARIAIAILLLAPVGLVLGAPFPAGLTTIGRHSAALVPWAFGINAFFTVLGTVLAQVMGMALGFRSVSLAAAVGYGLATGLGGLMQRRLQNTSGAS